MDKTVTMKISRNLKTDIALFTFIKVNNNTMVRGGHMFLFICSEIEIKAEGKMAGEINKQIKNRSKFC
jgi:hypothetical protein